MKSSFSSFNEKLFSSKEISGIGTVGTMSLLRGKAARSLNFVGRILAYSSTRSYGCFLLSFGIVSLLLNFGEYYFRSEPVVPFSYLVISMILALVSVPLLFFDRPMCVAVQDFPPTDRLLFEFLSIKRMHRNVEHITIPPLVALFMGFIPAVIGFFTSVDLVVLVLGLAIVTVIAFTSPEFSMILTILLLPYLPLFENSSLVLGVLSAITFVSFAMKVMLGKRVFHLDIYSVFVILLMILAFIGGAVSDGEGSMKSSLVLLLVLLSYFATSNLIINRRLADCAINAVIVSGIPISIISIIEFIVELPSTHYTPPSYSTPGTSAFFSTPSALAAFVLISAILTLIMAIEKKSRIKKAFYFVSFIVKIVLLGLIMQPEAWIAAIFAAVAYPVIKSRRIPLDVLVILVIISHLVFLLPTEIFDTVYEYLGVIPSFSERLLSYSDSLSTFVKNIWIGVGIGQNGGIGSSNLLLGIGAELGIFVLVIFVLMILLRFRHLSYYRIYVRNSLVITTGEMTAVALVAFLAFGSLEYIFADITVLYTFISVFAISSATLRTARKENDDRLGYYGDSRSSDSSALDVSVNR